MIENGQWLGESGWSWICLAPSLAFLPLLLFGCGKKKVPPAVSPAAPAEPPKPPEPEPPKVEEKPKEEPKPTETPPVELGPPEPPPDETEEQKKKRMLIEQGQKVGKHEQAYSTLTGLKSDVFKSKKQEQSAGNKSQEVRSQKDEDPALAEKKKAQIDAGKKVGTNDADYQTLAGLNDDIWGADGKSKDKSMDRSKGLTPEQKKAEIDAGKKVGTNTPEYMTLHGLTDDDIWKEMEAADMKPGGAATKTQVGGAAKPIAKPTNPSPGAAGAAKKAADIAGGKKVAANAAEYQTLNALNDEEIWNSAPPPKQSAAGQDPGKKAAEIAAGKKVAANAAEYQTLGGLNDEEIWGAGGSPAPAKAPPKPPPAAKPVATAKPPAAAKPPSAPKPMAKTSPIGTKPAKK